jgi:hypothetical protein
MQQVAKPPPENQAEDGGECAICLDPLSTATATVLPCGYVLHSMCAEGLRSFGEKKSLSMCHTKLPSWPEEPLDNYCRLYWVT